MSRSVDDALIPKAHSAAFLYSGELSPNSFTYIPFFVPPCLSADGGGKLRIKATIILDPPVNPDNQIEYSKARVTVALRKPAEVGHSQVGVSNDLVGSDKWWPVAQLDRQFHRAYATGEWELQVRLWTRDLPASHRQRFAVVIEVIDENGSAPVYEQTAAEAGVCFRPARHRAAA